MICDICKKVAEQVAQQLIDPDLRAKVINVAQLEYMGDGCQATEDAVVDETDDGDYWVEAWVFVRKADL